MKSKIILVNLISVFLIYVFAEFIIYNYVILKAYMLNSRVWPLKQYMLVCNKKYLDNKYTNFDKFYDTRIEFRPVSEGNSNRKPLLVFGCSFAYGASLLPEQTFTHKLSEITQRTVYNRAYSGWSVQNMLYQLRRNDFYNQIKEPEYIIYVYLNSHIQRIHSEVWMTDNQVFYKKTPRGLEENKFFSAANPFYNYIIKGVHWLYCKNVFAENSAEKKLFQQSPSFLNLHFIESKKEAEKHWKDTKFVVLVYSEMGCEDWKALEKEGIKVVKVKDLTSENLDELKYKISETDAHPSELAWDVITPSLIKLLNIK